MNVESQRSELKKLIVNGKERGFLTYCEINDHLPDDTHDTDQVAMIVNMIADMGIPVHDKPPDPDNLLFREDPVLVDEPDDADATLKTAVESEFGRTTDPVRMYMREMGTVDLLTHEEEIKLAKRIEDGIRQCNEAVASCPITIAEILRLAGLTEKGEIRLTDLLIEFVDPDASNKPIIQPRQSGPVSPLATSNTRDISLGPDPQEAKEQFKRIRRSYSRLRRAVERYGIGDIKVARIRQKIAAEVIAIKFTPKHVTAFWDCIKDLVELVRVREKAIMGICVLHASMPRKTFIETFAGRQTDKGLYQALLRAAGDNRAVILQYAEEIEIHRGKLEVLEQQAGVPICQLKES